MYRYVTDCYRGITRPRSAEAATRAGNDSFIDCYSLREA